MARARPIPLTAVLSFREAAAISVEVRAAEVFEHAEGVLDTRDTERVHDMRVATRRLRAVLEVFAPAFPDARRKSVLREVKALADALGARRDPDVQIGLLEEIADELGGSAAAGARSVSAELRAQQRAANEGLEATLERVRARDLSGSLAALVEEARA